MGEIFRRIRYLLNRRRFDAELESDMEFHREMAARAGRSNFGNTLRLRERSREACATDSRGHRRARASRLARVRGRASP